MQSINTPAPPPPNTPNNGGSRLRTVVGNRFERRCGCGCAQVLPADPTLKVVADFGAPKPFPTYLAAHSPDAGTYRGRPRAGESTPPSGGFQPASAPPVAPPKAPPDAFPRTPALGNASSLGAAQAPRPSAEPSPAPSRPTAEVAHTGPDAGPNPAAGRASSQLVFNAGQFESAKAGFASCAKDGETEEKLRERVHTTVLSDVEWQVRAMRDLHERLDVPGSSFARTSSPASSAGAPQGASAAPFSLPSQASPLSEPSVPRSSPPSSASAPSPGSGVGTARGGGRPACPSGSEAGVPDAPRQDGGAPSLGGGTCHPSSAEPLPSVAELVRQVETELTDASVGRKRNKLVAARKLLELRGLRSLHECGPADERALRALLATFEAVDHWDLREPLGTPAPQLDERLVLPA